MSKAGGRLHPDAHLRVFNRTGGALVGGRFAVYAAGGEQSVDYAPAAGGADGVLMYDIEDGEGGTLLTSGQQPVEVDAAYAEGTRLAVGAAGVGTQAAVGEEVVAIMVEASSAAGEIIQAAVQSHRKTEA